MNHFSQNTRAKASVASLLTAAILVAASSLLTTTTNPGGGVAYAQEEEEINLELTLESVSWDPKTKQVTVEFTSTCPTGSGSGDGPWLVSVEQNRGGKVISGDQFGPGELACDIHEFVTIEADEGFFVPGRAIVHIAGLVCGVNVCDEDSINEEVRLSPRG